MSLRFTFDPAKDAINQARHGLSLADAALVFNAPRKLTLVSSRADEPRLMDVALVEVVGVVLVLVYVQRADDEIRAISLRRASRPERMLYGQWQETH